MPRSTNSSQFSETCGIVKEIAESIFRGRRLSAIKLRLFSADLALIALAVRTAYLVDAIVVQEPAQFLSELVHRLRQVSPVFEDISVWHEASSDQSFVINTRLLARTISLCAQRHHGDSTAEANRSWTAFVRLECPLVLLPEIPEAVLGVLREIHFQSLNGKILVNVSRQLTIEDMVPLAAVLLEYPVAYVPISSEQTAFLGGEPLIICECHLVDSALVPPVRHSLIKFSCPRVIGQEHDRLTSRQLTERLRERFIPRIRDADTRLILDIEISMETLDRVAL